MRLLEWNAEVYDTLPLPHARWGEGVIERLHLAGRETVVDLGAGTGRDTELLLDRLPGGRVIAIDASARMLEQLAENLGERLDRVEVIRADLREPIELDARVEAVMTVATLHWIPDHRVVFRSAAAALRPGGVFAGEAGGAGNIDRVRAASAAVGLVEGDAWHFATAEDTAAALEAAQFTGVQARLVTDPVRLEPGAQFEAFIETVLLPAQLRELSPDRRAEAVHEVAAVLGEPVVDYVRLQFTAIRS